MRLGPGNSVVTDFLPILWSYAPESFTEHDYSRLDSEKAAQALRMFHSLAYGQHWASAVTQDVDVAVAIALDAASTGVVWNAWAMALERLRDRIAPTTGELEFGWFDKQQPVLGAWLLAVPQNAPHPKQAMEFIEYAIGKEQLKLAARYGNPPPRISILSDPESRERYRSFPAQLDSLQRARPRPRTPCWREVEKVVSGALSMWREEESKKVVAKLLGDLDSIRRWEERAGCVAQ
jgi:multiple sugar transport system substrate-binding protein